MAANQEQADYHLIGLFTRYSSWTARVEIVLEYFQIPYTEQQINFDDVRKFSPSGLVPLLECRSLSSTLRINDSIAICEFLAESNPHLTLWPRDRLLRAMARSAAAEMHSGFTGLRNACPTNFVVRYTGNIPVPEAAKKDIQRLFTIWDNARQAAKSRLAELGEKDEGFLFGGFSIADAFFWPVLWRFRTYNLPLESASADVVKWMETMWNDPATQRLAHKYYRQAELPESHMERYENIFRDREDIQYGRFPEDWKFTVPESS
ncbi:hypothetical protein IFM61606_03539 [Aspergillus udagawae]|uniref:GST N-terminal domain-containing protein n=1 Tax=Aspergillus udagawae TaxID=91492 RepID=A0A8H3PFR3_9EURO|nr:hypothetical protein IFM46972_07821 [Aspergillus udagawae]GFF49601.1 hypothetical protein IFM51744_07126 [Aspergillus udagawae]GFF88761.1 hypothetical protein IFM53868_05610 [Aspergillus udagawae]GFG13661.1 hypothetical protein IFM5058_06560 [Aspergillus udagawae]GFG23652.1 hypothetical protein IFM61606_03539 [Aspergillus udagawae]